MSRTFSAMAASVAEMEALGGRLAPLLWKGVRWVGLRGDLGAGKTTLVRGILRALGHAGAVKSPTFSLVEGYTLNGRELYHFDLYRLEDPEELEFLGWRDYAQEGALCLVEWPERGAGVLPPMDIDITIQKVNEARRVSMESHNAAGDALLSSLS